MTSTTYVPFTDGCSGRELKISHAIWIFFFNFG